jgi:hypothetical protein
MFLRAEQTVNDRRTCDVVKNVLQALAVLLKELLGFWDAS